MSPAGPSERGRPHTGARSGTPPSCAVWPTAARCSSASSGRVTVCRSPSGVKIRSRIASSQVVSVSFSTTRPMSEKPALQYDQVAPSGWFCATFARAPTYFSRQSSPRPVSVKTSPSMPLVWVSRCRIVTAFVTCGSARRSSGSTAVSGASRSSSPESTSCMTRVAVQTFVMEPIWKSESVVAGTPVSVLSTPWAVSTSSSCPLPSSVGRVRRMPRVAPGT